MLVIEYEAYVGDAVPDALVYKYVTDVIARYRLLPPNDSGEITHQVYVGNLSLIREFAKAIFSGELSESEVAFQMAHRQVYFLFLKNLFLEHPPELQLDAIASIFLDSRTSFSC